MRVRPTVHYLSDMGCRWGGERRRAIACLSPNPDRDFSAGYKKRNPEIDRVWLSRRCYGTTFSMIRTPASYDAWALLLAVALVRDTGIIFDRSLPPTARAPWPPVV